MLQQMPCRQHLGRDLGASRRCSSHRTHRDCRSEAHLHQVIFEQQSTEEIFLEHQRCELELELAALSMILNSTCSRESLAEVYALQGDENDSEEEEAPRDEAPEEHIPDDEDCASLQAQLEQMRLQISTSTISVDERTSSSMPRRLSLSRDKPRLSKRARK